MEKEVLKEPKFVEDIVKVIRSGLDKEQLLDRLNDYHENDIAQSLEFLTKDERLSLYNNWHRMDVKYFFIYRRSQALY